MRCNVVFTLQMMLVANSMAGHPTHPRGFARVGFLGETIMRRETRSKGTPGGHKGPLPAPHHPRPYGLTSELLKKPTRERPPGHRFAHRFMGTSPPISQYGWMLACSS